MRAFYEPRKGATQEESSLRESSFTMPAFWDWRKVISPLFFEMNPLSRSFN